MTEPRFEIHAEGAVYTEFVLDRCRQLIAAAIWNGIAPDQFESWVNNFRGDVERYFAACVLDALIYRSEEQTVALMEHLFQRSIPDFLADNPPPQVESRDWAALLRAGPLRRHDPRVRLVPVIRNSDPPTKSGPVLARLYRRRLRLDDRWMIWPWQVESERRRGVQVFVFVDDFLGSGRQFTSFAQTFDLPRRLRGAMGLYAPLAAHEAGIEAVRRTVPGVHVCAVERLTPEYGLFHPDSRWFRDGRNTPEAAERFYHNILHRARVQLPARFRRGFGRLAVAYSFQHAIPNNCLPLLWFRSPTWKPLIER